MAKDPICGMDVSPCRSVTLTEKGKTYYFCSEHCLKKFARQNNISDKKVSTCLIQPKTKWYKNKIIIITFILTLSLILSYRFPILEPFRKSLLMYFGKIWWAMLLGLVLGGIIDYFIPREYVSHVLAKPNKETIFYSVILGFFMSACSHGILALSIELHKKGASNPAVVAFLLASPWANLPLTIMLIGFFGIKAAIYIVACALIIAVATGFIYQYLESKDLIEINKNIKEIDEGFSIVADLKRRVKTYKISGERITRNIKGIFSGSIALANMVMWWILVGIGLASFAAAYIPQHIFHNYMGPTALGLFVTLMLATVLEVCSEGTAPLAF